MWNLDLKKKRYEWLGRESMGGGGRKIVRTNMIEVYYIHVQKYHNKTH
jgi:hypothetical protein